MNLRISVNMISLILILIGALINPISAEVEIDEDLEDHVDSEDGHFKIAYTDCSPTQYPDKCMTTSDINTLSVLLEELYGIYTDPSGDFQLRDPTHGQTLLIQVHPLEFLGYSDPDDGIELNNLIFGSQQLTRTTLHELFHHAVFNYGRFHDFTDEGMAKMMEDKVYLDLDTDPASPYHLFCNVYLDLLSSRSLLDQKYSSCLFWTYFTEQFGAVRAEPQVGIDAIRADLEHYDSGYDDIQRIDATLDEISPGMTFKGVFMDFIVANYAKDLPGPSVPSKYKYIDDAQTPGVYRSVGLAVDKNMLASDSIAATDEVRDWSAKYYQIWPDANAPIISISVLQPSSSSTNLIYDLLVIKNGDIVEDASEFNVEAKDFQRSIINDGYERVVLIVGGSDRPAGYRYAFSTGGEDTHLNIIWPKYDDAARIDLTDLNKFQIHLEVLDNGGTLDNGVTVVSGLEPDDFQVNVDGTSFDVVTGTEVMGQYWLLIQPEGLAAGTYDLDVSISDGSISDTEGDAIEFMSVLNSDSVLVIDRSGSMLQPNWDARYYEDPDPTDKIYGAIDAATLYANSFRPNDKIGLVWFSSDAFTAMPLANLDDSSRNDLVNSIRALDQDASNAWRRTSIGDGLWNAAEELDNRGDIDHDRTIIVLSDGKQNEARNADEVVCEDGCKIDLNDPNTVIHTVALGSDADRDILETLADDTDGLFEYVIEPQSGDVNNDLADVYRVFAETILREQRITTIRGEYDEDNPERCYAINIENGATEANFVVNSNTAYVEDARMPLVTLRDPEGNSVAPRYLEVTHALFSVPLPESGIWTVELHPYRTGPVEFPITYDYGYYLIEASVKSKITMEAFLGLPVEKRVVGVQLPVLVFLTDTKPITGAKIEAHISAPELADPIPWGGETIRLFDDGMHGDGRADDGVYAGIFSNTYRDGIYDMKIVAEGESPIAGSFRREAKFAFNIKSDSDSNEDGVPDGWSTEHGLDPTSQDDSQTAGGDPDGDGLKIWRVRERNRSLEPR